LKELKRAKNEDQLGEATPNDSILSPTSVPSLPKNKILDISQKNDLIKYQMEKIEERYIKRE
jgi:hypothetical protein